MNTNETAAPVHSFNPNDKNPGFYLEGATYPQYVGHAPEGGMQGNGIYSAEPFCFVYAGCLVLSNDPSQATGPKTQHFPRLQEGQVIEIQGYGLFKVLKPGFMTGSSVRIVPV